MNSQSGRAAATDAAIPVGQLPGWPSVLAVVAHPDDETFGLGAILDQMAAGGASVHVLCYTHGEASTLNESGADLRRARQIELRLASQALGLATVTLLDYPDGRLGSVAPGELAGHVARIADRVHADGLLVFDDNGITGHPDHRAATRAAVQAASACGRSVLAWALPAPIAALLSEETGQRFVGQQAADIDLRVQVDRSRQRQAALLHKSQISPTAVLWRRLQLQANWEHLRWLIPPR